MIAHFLFDLLPPPAPDVVLAEPAAPWLPIVSTIAVLAIVARAVARRRATRGKDDGA